MQFIKKGKDRVAIQEVGGVNLENRVITKKTEADDSPEKTGTTPLPGDDAESDAKIMSDPTMHGFYEFRSRKFLQKYGQPNLKQSMSDVASS